ncbi:fimbrial biogenesis outer membrane usher protein [Serratia proteamaculans]|uniref:fimbria/pilus outer membrane usher protein n=1 Tax=Serratia proteamaculans TaxID=28151 RepID=UPI0010762E60|nr:fimbria/pilus outer membrane usher protein [Serratia proteamaculans]TFZ50985.1 fimbrial biogenesis outer membrane usher protein [Serratia proteamaculans]
MKIKSITRRWHFSAITTACCCLFSGIALPAIANSDTERHGMALAATFNPDFLNDVLGSNVDLSRYERGNPLLPGAYRVDVYLNGQVIARETVTVKQVNGTPAVCLNNTLLSQLAFNTSAPGVNTQTLQQLKDPADCITMDALTDRGSLRLNTNDLRLDIALPQEMITRHARGYVDPALWDDGEPAMLLGYNANYYQSERAGQTQKTGYVGLNGGLNLAGWMFRHTGNLNWDDQQGSRYKSTRNYLQHDITPWRARLTLGDSFTSGELFDSFAFRGVQVATDDRMLPDSLRAYAPTVRGVAQTNAHVTIKQNGVLLYDTTVPPGPFVINDLYPTGYGGDLDVQVEEADGRTSSFKVAYSSVAQLLRPGMSRYNLVAGTIQNQNLSYTPKVMQATLQHGLSNLLTGYGGVLGSDHYGSALLGAAFNTPVGALALDVTGAKASADGRSSQGTSWRATYNKMFSATDSNLSLAAYRFSSSGYLDLNNALMFTDEAREGRDNNDLWRPRNRYSLTLNQGLAEGWGQLFFSGYSQNYWQRNTSDRQYQFGYSNYFKRLSYTLSAGRARNTDGNEETQYLLSMTLPLGSGAHSPNLNLSLGHDGNGFNNQTNLNGLLGEDNQYSYNLGAAYDRQNRTSANLSGGYRSPYSNLSGSYSQGSDYHSASAGLSGALIAHGGGITLSPYNSNTLAVIHAPDAGGARVLGYSGIRLDDRGYAIVPYLNTYQVNDIGIDTKGLPADVELQTTSQQVVPRDGAIVQLNYPTVSGRAVLIYLATQNLPFGAEVLDEQGRFVGTVGQGGMIYARLPTERSRLTIKRQGGDCRFNVSLPQQKPAGALAFERITARCEASQ